MPTITDIRNPTQLTVNTLYYFGKLEIVLKMTSLVLRLHGGSRDDDVI